MAKIFSSLSQLASLGLAVKMFPTISLAEKKDLLWYEGPNGTCNLSEPTLLNMGDDQPLHLMYPVHWRDALSVLAKAKEMASERDALLVLLLYGEASDRCIELLILELAEARVLPLWIGEQNRKKFDKIIAMLSSQS